MRATTIFPLANLHNLRTELDGLFRPFQLRSGFPARWSPRVDTHETEDAFLVAVDLPGVASEDVSVNLEKGVLTVSGERKSSFGLNGDAEQRSHGKFEHAFPVPDAVDTESIDATYKDGVMTLTLRKSKESQPRQIPITVG
ncbi:MAG: Hsp20/alpha crystallin family protein [Gemmatimonadetes bacterium]|nr:Hsp20/alpha crystallin family protein [Gemmatimonadota bacterium]